MKLTGTLAIALAGVALIAGCGDDGDDPGQPAASTPTAPAAATSPSQAQGVVVDLEAIESDGLSFSEESLQAAPGRITLLMANPKPNRQQHAIAILGGNGQSVAGKPAAPGGKSLVTADLVPGDYTFFCPIGNHRGQGMEGVLVVE
jgi:plastocyanin